jgi:hypothetical protein
LKINRLEAHDRYEHFTNQSFDISACCQDLINKRPFGNHPFYIFAHARTVGMDEKYKMFLTGKYASFDQIPEKRLIWQPRLTKPKAQTNSMLFKAYPGTDNIKVIWMIPDKNLWGQYKKGNVTENLTVLDSIKAFQENREKLEEKESDDLSDMEIDAIYLEISASASNTQLILS